MSRKTSTSYDALRNNLVAAMGNPHAARAWQAAIILRRDWRRAVTLQDNAVSDLRSTENTLHSANLRILQLEQDLNHANKLAREWEGQAHDWEDTADRWIGVVEAQNVTIRKLRSGIYAAESGLLTYQLRLFTYLSIQVIGLWGLALLHIH